MSADARSSAKPRIPRLRDGQRLTRSEFMRRWEAMPELKFAERIEGKVSIMTPPISLDHSEPLNLLIWCLMTYRMATPGIRDLNETTIHVDGDNDLQPDTGLFIDPDCGGQTRFAGRFVEGAPELIVEISESTVGKDLGSKFDVYRRAGVLEYIVWQTRKKLISCFVNHEGQFEPAVIQSGVFKSDVFPGLWIDVSALVVGDLNKFQVTSAAGLADPSHAKFKRKLAKARKG